MTGERKINPARRKIPPSLLFLLAFLYNNQMFVLIPDRGLRDDGIRLHPLLIINYAPAILHSWAIWASGTNMEPITRGIKNRALFLFFFFLILI